VRQEKGLSLEEIARSTSISLRFLQAIENEDFAELPSGVYSTSYIRQYATAIAYDPSAVLERYREQMKPEPKAASGLSHRGVSWQYRRLRQALQNCLEHLTPYRRGYPNT
jgi:cytoskeletal protein RodZ